MTLVVIGVVAGSALAENSKPDLSSYMINLRGDVSPEAFSKGYAFATWLHSTDLDDGGFNSMDYQALQDAKEDTAYILSEWGSFQLTGVKQICIEHVLDRSVDQVDPVMFATEMARVTSMAEKQADDVYRRVSNRLSKPAQNEIENVHVAAMIRSTALLEPDTYNIAVDFPAYSQDLFHKMCHSMDLYSNKKNVVEDLSEGTSIQTIE